MTLERVLDYNVMPGVSNDEGDGDEWPQLREKVLAADILIIATPTWLGQPSSVAKRVLERMDALLSEKDDEGRPVVYNKVAGVVVTGNEDGAHHVINEVSGALLDIGFTAPGQALTYWNKGPGETSLEPGGTYTADRTFAEVSADDYEALIIPGGTVGANKLRGDTDAVAFIRGFFEQGKSVGAICHARGR